ncbi:MAG: hypothetical protein LPK09_11495 [Hymenobacteraceae bacterium]|nr:hypothetical protein [Hymenobacteraceae bacterium]
MAALIIAIVLNIITVLTPGSQSEQTKNNTEGTQTITTLGGSTTWNEAGQ